MNTLQAKQLNLPNLMASLGYQPTEVKKGGKEYWYKSPFRNEEDASFHGISSGLGSLGWLGLCSNR